MIAPVLNTATKLTAYLAAELGQEPTILENSLISINKKIAAKDITRGMILAFDPNKISDKTYKFTSGSIFIFRVVGLPNEIIEYDNSLVKINGVPLDLKKVGFPKVENQILSQQHSEIIKKIKKIYPLSDNEFFVMGDNLENAFDSRYFGPIKFDSIIGIVDTNL